MNYEKIDEKSKKIWTSIIIIFIFIFSTSICVKAFANVSNINLNKLYVEIINYSMPVVKVVAFDPEDLTESRFSYKSYILGALGLDISKPTAILGKEISYLYGENLISNSQDDSGKLQFALDPFKLNETDVSKVATNSTQPSSGTASVSPAYNSKLKRTLPSKPEILIYHSHTTEAYSPYGTDSFNETQNVCAVGDALASELINNYGISVIHDKTVHNAANYYRAYDRSGETLDKYLKQYGDFKMIIDLHRDSNPDKNAVTVKLNNENVARCMFVMTRKNPHFDKNMKIVNGLRNISDSLFKGLMANDYYYDVGMNYYNQNKSNNAFLIEVGSCANTIDEAKTSAKYIARLIAEYLTKNGE